MSNLKVLGVEGVGRVVAVGDGVSPGMGHSSRENPRLPGSLLSGKQHFKFRRSVLDNHELIST